MKHTTEDVAVVNKVANAILHVHDLKRSAAWYADILQMPLAPLDEQQPFYVIDMDNGTHLMLDDHRNMTDVERYPICMLKTADIERAYNFVQQSGINVTLERQSPHPGLDYFNVEDSEGNIIMICQSEWVNPDPLTPMDPAHPLKNHLESVVIPVQQVERATTWYSRLVGQEIIPERLDDGPIYSFDMPGGTGILLDDNRNNQDLDHFPTFILKADNIDAAYRYMKNKGVEIVRDIQFQHYFMVKDLEGNSVLICS